MALSDPTRGIALDQLQMAATEDTGLPFDNPGDESMTVRVAPDMDSVRASQDALIQTAEQMRQTLTTTAETLGKQVSESLKSEFSTMTSDVQAMVDQMVNSLQDSMRQGSNAMASDMVENIKKVQDEHNRMVSEAQQKGIPREDAERMFDSLYNSDVQTSRGTVPIAPSYDERIQKMGPQGAAASGMVNAIDTVTYTDPGATLNPSRTPLPGGGYQGQVTGGGQEYGAFHSMHSQFPQFAGRFAETLGQQSGIPAIGTATEGAAAAAGAEGGGGIGGTIANFGGGALGGLLRSGAGAIGLGGLAAGGAAGVGAFLGKEGFRAYMENIEYARSLQLAADATRFTKEEIKSYQQAQYDVAMATNLSLESSKQLAEAMKQTQIAADKMPGAITSAGYAMERFGLSADQASNMSQFYYRDLGLGGTQMVSDLNEAAVVARMAGVNQSALTQSTYQAAQRGMSLAGEPAGMSGANEVLNLALGRGGLGLSGDTISTAAGIVPQNLNQVQAGFRLMGINSPTFDQMNNPEMMARAGVRNLGLYTRAFDNINPNAPGAAMQVARLSQYLQSQGISLDTQQVREMMEKSQAEGTTIQSQIEGQLNKQMPQLRKAASAGMMVSDLEKVPDLLTEDSSIIQMARGALGISPEGEKIMAGERYQDQLERFKEGAGGGIDIRYLTAASEAMAGGRGVQGLRDVRLNAGGQNISAYDLYLLGTQGNEKEIMGDRNIRNPNQMRGYRADLARYEQLSKNSRLRQLAEGGLTNQELNFADKETERSVNLPGMGNRKAKAPAEGGDGGKELGTSGNPMHVRVVAMPNDAGRWTYNSYQTGLNEYNRNYGDTSNPSHPGAR